VPAFGWLLAASEVAAVVTYVRNAWGNTAPPITADQVARARQDLSRRSD
jgi:mono/diheme cytochrome c family protein